MLNTDTLRVLSDRGDLVPSLLGHELGLLVDQHAALARVLALPSITDAQAARWRGELADVEHRLEMAAQALLVLREALGAPLPTEGR